ncbi:MAG: ComF family protein [Pirellulaceae bacterium]
MNAGASVSRAASSRTSFLSPRWLRRWTASTADLLFPPTCTFCNEPSPPREDGTLLCETCFIRLSHSQQSICPRCGMPAPAAAAYDGKCADCRDRKFAFSGVRSLGLYENDLRQAVLRMKHHEQEHLAMALGRRLATVMAEKPFPEQPDLVVPIPMHWLPRLLRGTSAAETLARSLAAAVSLPVAGDLLYCRRLLKKQGMLLATERQTNVRGAFAASRRYNISGAKILLVDDVITTGATCDSAGQVLLKAGAARVYAISVARGTGMWN